MENRKIWLIADTHFGYKGDDEEWLKDSIGYFEDTIIPIMKKEVKISISGMHENDDNDLLEVVSFGEMYLSIPCMPSMPIDVETMGIELCIASNVFPLTPAPKRKGITQTEDVEYN